MSFNPKDFAKGGSSSNTPPSIPNHHEKNSLNSQATTGGEDWLQVSLYLQHKQFAWLAPRLERLREAAEEGLTGKDEMSLGGIRMLCLPRSAPAGKEGSGITYRWRLKGETGLVLNLMRRETPHPTLPNGEFRATSEQLMRFGFNGCWRQARDWLAVLGIEVASDKLSRVDPCADLPDFDLNALSQPFRDDWFVSRAREGVTHGEAVPTSEFERKRVATGFRWGKGNTLLRVYDKYREVRSNDEKKTLMIARRWGYEPQSATRVEYQLRRNSLKRYGVDTVADWLEKRAAIVAHLTTDWFRLTDGPFDPKHPERSKMHPIWGEVSLAFCDWAGDSVEVELAPLPKGEANVEQLVKQLYGLAISIAVRSGRRINSSEDFVHEIAHLLLQSADGREVGEDFRRKTLELGLGGDKS